MRGKRILVMFMHRINNIYWYIEVENDVKRILRTMIQMCCSNFKTVCVKVGFLIWRFVFFVFKISEIQQIPMITKLTDPNILRGNDTFTYKICDFFLLSCSAWKKSTVIFHVSIHFLEKKRRTILPTCVNQEY